MAEALGKGFTENDNNYPNPLDYVKDNHNSYRKYRIVYNYSKINFKPFDIIYYKDILIYFIVKNGFEKLIDYLKSVDLEVEFKKTKLSVKCEFENEISKLFIIKNKFKQCVDLFDKIEHSKIDEKEKIKSQFYSKEFITLKEEISNILKSESLIKRNKVLQIIGNNLRRTSNPFDFSKADILHAFTIVELINKLIKSIRYNNKLSGKNTEIVIDSLRNPLEIMFFKQRFSAFYVISVNCEDFERNQAIDKYFEKEKKDDILKILNEEHTVSKSSEYYKQNVSNCIQLADIHINNRELNLVFEKNELIKTNKENTTPYFSWGMQLLKYVSLIDQPGLITPSPEERCMQIAYTAKYNSGCISRQVGASITDENYSLKAIGWNNTPEGHVPCNLRNVNDLLDDVNDIEAFTKYERTDDFKQILKPFYQDQIINHKEELKGRNVCFCFKTIYNSKFEGKNQVHTRSLHAEESAFLQITKYGGQGIIKGKLFTTASPCELCSKKAYQLGIKVIYYVDPYPGIAKQHILDFGIIDKKPELRLFNGAIGNAYHWLYEPFMAYKDELALILEHNIDDLTKTQKNKILELEEKNKLLNEKLKNLTKENMRIKMKKK